MRNAFRARLALLSVAMLTVGCDRVTKHVATAALASEPARSYMADTFRLDYAENTGGFLSIGASLPEHVRTMLFTIGTGVVLVALIIGSHCC
jgi:signal peptidase II